MTHTTNHLNRSNFIKILILLAFCLLLVNTAIWTIDHKSFIGCVIVDYEPDNVLVIKLDDELATGTDASCKATGELLLEICKQGYKVRVTNWTLTEVINLEQAFWLARGY